MKDILKHLSGWFLGVLLAFRLVSTLSLTLLQTIIHNAFWLKMNLFYFSCTSWRQGNSHVTPTLIAKYWLTALHKSNGFDEKWLSDSTNIIVFLKTYLHTGTRSKSSLFCTSTSYVFLRIRKENQNTIKITSRKTSPHIFTKPPYSYCFALNLKQVAYVFQIFLIWLKAIVL